MSESTKFEVIDRRKFKAEEEERETAEAPASDPTEPAVVARPRLVEPEERAETGAGSDAEDETFAEMPPPPTREETREQKSAYEASAERLEDLVRAQNPGMGAQQPVDFEQLVQQFYVSAMLQMGAGTPQGQPVRVDLLGARQTIDLLGILAEKTRGNLTDAEDRVLQTVLYEARMTFLEVTRMITLQGVQAPAPPTGKK